MSENQVPSIEFETARALIEAYEHAVAREEGGVDIDRGAQLLQQAWDKLFTGARAIEWRGRPWGSLNVNPGAFGTATIPDLHVEEGVIATESDSRTGPEIAYDLLDKAGIDSLSGLKAGLRYFVCSEGRDAIDVRIESVHFRDRDGDDFIVINARLVP